MHKSASVLLSVAVALLAGCAISDFEGAGDDKPSIPGPGDPSWKPGVSLQCTKDDECGRNESCLGGSCRLKGCGPEVEVRTAPLGEQRYFAVRRELVSVETAALHGYKLAAANLVRPAGVTADWSVSGATLVDAAGGHFLTSRPEALAVALSGAKKVTIIAPSERFDLALDFVPRAIAGGDVDNDGFDEVVAFGSAGQVALCQPRLRRCTGADFSHIAWEGLDVAVADVDGDQFAEPLFLAMEGTRRILVVWNVTHAGTREAVTLTVEPGKTETASVVSVERIAAGDLDGDGAAEIVGFENRGLLTDKVYTFALRDGRLPKLADASVGFSARDVLVEDLDVSSASAGRAEIAVLSSASAVRLLRAGSSLSSLEQFLDVELAGTSGGQRLAAADVDGDSPMGRLIEGPKLVSGQVQPVAVLTFPPYSRTYSDGAAGVELGVGTSVTDSKWTSVSVTHGVSVGYGFGLGKLFDASVGGSYSFSRSWDWGADATVSVSNSWSLGSREDIYGSDYAGVVVEAGCFAAYTYEVEDPAEVIDGAADKQTFTVFAPAGGQTTIWTSARYNAMAQDLGYLPQLAMPFSLGDPKSYPSQMITLEGNLVTPEQLLFPSPPSYRVSDIGDVSWSLSGSTSATNGKTTTFGVSGSVGLTIGSVDVGYSYDKSWSKGGGISVGEDISFAGWVPSIADDPSTPEDEYASLGFAFTPYVYRQVYTVPSGGESAYYVLMYQVRP